jgi:hypothetical protein
MVPIEQKDGTEQDRGSKPGEITHSIPRRGRIINRSFVPPVNKSIADFFGNVLFKQPPFGKRSFALKKK